MDATTKRRHTCETCGKRFTSSRAHSRNCSPKCRQRAYRRRADGDRVVREYEDALTKLLADDGGDEEATAVFEERFSLAERLLVQFSVRDRSTNPGVEAAAIPPTTTTTGR
jgi:predicted  nucleic acid-binding Zn-ribbon protein